MAKRYLLDFEKPIIKLEEKLTQIKELASKSGKNLDDEAISIEKKINNKEDAISKVKFLKKKVKETISSKEISLDDIALNILDALVIFFISKKDLSM